LAGKWRSAPRGSPGESTAGKPPLLGGVAIFVAWLLPLLALYLADGQFRNSFGDPFISLGILLGASAMFVMGLWHDLRKVALQFRLPIQFTLAIAVYLLGIRIQAVSNPFGPALHLGLFAPVVTAFWIMGITYAINRMDGLPGLAAGVSVLIAITMALASRFVGARTGVVYAVPIAGASVGFLVYNFPPPRVLMGASGTFFVGFTLAAISLLTSQKGHVAVTVMVPLIAFGVPLTNASLAVFRRFIAGRALFEKDHRHVHQMLLALGLSERAVVIILYAVTIVFSLAALLLVNASAIRTFLIVFVVLAAVVMASRRLGYHEFRHLWGHLKHGLGHRGELVFQRELVAATGRGIQEEVSFDGIWDKVLLVARLLDFDRLAFEPSASGDRASLHGRRLWAKTHDFETAPMDTKIELPVAQDCCGGSLVFERLGRHRITSAEREALANLCEHVSARMTSLGSDVEATSVGAGEALS